MSRKLWTDGWNSFWHFTLGALAFKIPVILLIFLVYQAFSNYDRNVTTDLLEFFIGLISMIAASYTANHFYEIPHELFSEIIPDIVSVL